MSEVIVKRDLREKNAQGQCMRREPLEEGGDGLMEGHCSFYFSAKGGKAELAVLRCWAGSALALITTDRFVL